jgi:VIT1/CCC1 family predicted Fe2+/Mn2+ transporter
MFATLIVAFLIGAFVVLVIYAYTTDNKWITTDK